MFPYNLKIRDKKFLFRFSCHMMFYYMQIFTIKHIACNCCVENLINENIYYTQNFKKLQKKYENIEIENQINNNKEQIIINEKKLTIEKSIKYCDYVYDYTHEGYKTEKSFNCFFKKIEETQCCLYRLKEEDCSNKKLIVYYRGNAEDIFDIPQYLKNFKLLKEYDILMPEIPGYPGNHKNNFSEELRHKQQEPIINFAKKYYSGKDNRIFCYSLGCHFGILLAAKDAELSKNNENIFKKLILACPFYDESTASTMF